MRRQRRGFAILALLLSFAFVAAACGSDSKKSTGSGETGSSSSGSGSQEVPTGGTLTIGAEQEPDCMDWIGSCGGSSWGYWMVAVNTLPRAFDILKDSSGKYGYTPSILLKGEPKLETSPVQKVTYQIAEAAVWSDGQPITSTDFKYTWDQIANTEDVYDKTGYNLIESVDDTNPKVAVVTFKAGKTYGDWKGLFTGNYGIFPDHLLKGVDRDTTMKDGYKFSGGPWILDSWTKTDSVVLIPNPKYWGNKPKLEKVIFKVQADTSAEFTAFKSDQVSMIYPQPQLDAVDQITAGLPGKQKVISLTTPNFEALWMNMGKAPFDNENVRKAVAYAIDRTAIVDRLFGPLGVKEPLNVIGATLLKQYQDTSVFSQYKLDKAQVDKLLTGDGFAKGADGIYAKNGERLTFTVRSTAGNKRRELTEQVLQQQLKDAGIEMSIDNTKAGTLFGELLPLGDFQASIYTFVITTLGPSNCNIECTQNSKPIGEKGGNNYQRTSIPELDTLLTAADGELDDAKLVDLVKKGDKVSADKMISLPIDPLPTILLWSDKVVGPIDDSGILGPFWNMNEWGVTG